MSAFQAGFVPCSFVLSYHSYRRYKWSLHSLCWRWNTWEFICINSLNIIWSIQLRRLIQLYSKDNFCCILWYKGHRLKEYVLKNTTAFSAVHCMQICLSKGTECKSINHRKISHSTGECQLNNNTAACNTLNLIADKEFNYFERNEVSLES